MWEVAVDPTRLYKGRSPVGRDTPVQILHPVTQEDVTPQATFGPKAQTSNVAKMLTVSSQVIQRPGPRPCLFPVALTSQSDAALIAGMIFIVN